MSQAHGVQRVPSSTCRHTKVQRHGVGRQCDIKVLEQARCLKCRLALPLEMGCICILKL